MSVTISLTDFVDFTIRTGPQRLTKVREIKNRDRYNPAFDFWRQLREGIAEFHRNGHNITWLQALPARLSDPKKVKRYPEAIRSYIKFLGRKQIEWFEPPRSKWTYADLTININPELGLKIKGNPYAIKLFFKDDKLDKRKSDIVFYIMEEQLRDLVLPNTTMAILDVKTPKLLTPTKIPDNMSILLESEAIAFMQIWNRI